MNSAIASAIDTRPIAMTRINTEYDECHLRAAIDAARRRIAPLWSLRHFVAVNPFLGWTDRPFTSACAAFRRIARTDVVMPRSFYRDAIADGRIEPQDLAAAIARHPAGERGPRDASQLLASAMSDTIPSMPPRRAAIATVSEVLDRLANGDRQISRTAFMIDEISRWCAAYFDQGQALWPLPSRELPPYAAWRAGMRHDRNPEAMGIKGFRATVAAMPDDPIAAIGHVLAELDIPPRAWTDYLLRALFDISGWAGMARQRGWDAQLRSRQDDTLLHLLAIRVVWGFALFCERKDVNFRDAWRQAMAEASQLPCDDSLDDDPQLVVDLLLHGAFEHAAQRDWLARLQGRSVATSASSDRPTLQVVFCIDVRSEPFRRALEANNPNISTLGFAGFFGFAIERLELGEGYGNAHCPALLAPAFAVPERSIGADEDGQAQIITRMRRRKRAADVWNAFRSGAVSCFSFVETAGVLYAPRLLDLALSRPQSAADSSSNIRTVPDVRARRDGSRPVGMSVDEQVAAAEGALLGMSLTNNFAPLVMLVGHGSSSINNPHASGLDCGACGGHSGDTNARIAAMVFNDPAVRAGLGARGILIPADTVFVAALHDTTTDDVRCLDIETLPSTASGALAQASTWLKNAGERCRRERAQCLQLDADEPIAAAVRRRAHDASQVRPEWGLAGNSAFIAAPRDVTAGINLRGRAFLHSYDWRIDRDFAVLAVILGAPMVVASWINLQYFGSAANPRAFGAGNKVLHNVVAGLGVLEGNAGDLKNGLPWQSVHDGRRLAHEPLRLNVFIAAPVAALDAAIAAQPGVRDLIANQWLHLFALDDDGKPSQRRLPEGGWEMLA